MSITTVGLDADDTLWHNETIFRLTHKRFNELLGEFADEEALEARLAAIEPRLAAVLAVGLVVLVAIMAFTVIVWGLGVGPVYTN